MKEESAYQKSVRESHIAFGEWLYMQGLILTPSQQEYGVYVWDTPKGEWLTMEDLYNRWESKKAAEIVNS